MNPDSLLNWLIPATGGSASLFALALLLQALLRRSSAAIRHSILAAAFLGAGIFSLALLLPKWNWPILEPPPYLPANLVSLPYLQHSSGITIVSPAAPIPAAPAEPFRLARIGSGLREFIALGWLVWITGTTITLGRLAAGLFTLGKVSRGSRAASIASLENSRVEIRTTPDIDVPLTWGWLRPEILLPRSFNDWSLEQQRLALAHEAAHVRRRDWPVLIFARVVCALFWFNPLAWISLRRLQAEQEKAADDLVLAAAQPDAYASALVDFARALRGPASRLPAVPILRSGSLEDRVRSLLDPRASRRPPGSAHRAAIASLLGGLALIPVVQLTARETAPLPSRPAAETPARELTEQEKRFVGQWQGGGMFPTTFTFKADGTYEVRTVLDGARDPRTAYGQNRIGGTWRVEGDLLMYEMTSPTNAPAKTRRILQVSSNFFQWQFVGEESQNIFGYHRLTNTQLATIAGTVLRQGKPLTDITVLLEPFTPDGQRLPTTETTTDREGRFAFHGLAPGRYKVSRSIAWDAITDQGSSQTATWTHGQVVELPKDKTIDLTLGQGRTIRGQFLPPAGLAKEQIAFSAGDFRFLTPAQRRADAIPIVYVLEISRDGAFTIPDVPPGDYNIFAQVRKMDGPLDADHIASASTRITLPAGPGEYDSTPIQLTTIER